MSWIDSFWSTSLPLPDGLALSRVRSVPTATGEHVDLVSLRAGPTELRVLLWAAERIAVREVRTIAEWLRGMAESLGGRSATSGARLELGIATESATAELIDACLAHGLVVVDRAGTLVVHAGSVFVHVCPRLPGRTAPKSLFTANRERLLLCLLAAPRRSWSVRELADASATSVGSAQALLSSLEQRGWVERRGLRGGFKVRELSSMLRAWMDAPGQPWAAIQRFHAPDVGERALRRAADVSRDRELPAIFTMASGLKSEEVFVSALPHAMYCSGDIEPVIDALQLRRTTPYNFYLLRPHREADTDKGGIYHAPRELPHGLAVHPVQLMRDLFRGPGRSAEQATHLARRYLDTEA